MVAGAGGASPGGPAAGAAGTGRGAGAYRGSAKIFKHANNNARRVTLIEEGGGGAEAGRWRV
jgi:hypothetical protein